MPPVAETQLSRSQELGTHFRYPMGVEGTQLLGLLLCGKAGARSSARG